MPEFIFGVLTGIFIGWVIWVRIPKHQGRFKAGK